MSKRILSGVVFSVTAMAALVAGGCSSSGQKPYGLTGQDEVRPTQGQVNREADEHRSPGMRHSVNVAPNYPG